VFSAHRGYSITETDWPLAQDPNDSNRPPYREQRARATPGPWLSSSQWLWHTNARIAGLTVAGKTFGVKAHMRDRLTLRPVEIYGLFTPGRDFAVYTLINPKPASGRFGRVDAPARCWVLR